MDQIINLVAEKAGVSPEQARTATETVIGFLKERLPGPIAGQIDQILAGQNVSGFGGLAKGIGGMFSKK